MCTELEGLRATWSNSCGAVACTIERASPRGNRTRSPSMSHPAPRSSSSASGAPRKSMPTCSRIVSALCSIRREPLLAQHLDRTQLARDERHTLGHGCQARRRPSFPAAGSAPAGGRGLVAHVLLLSGRVARRRRRERSVAPGRTSADRRSRRAGGRIARVGDAHRADEVLLETGLDGGLDLLDPAHHVLDLPRAARFSRAMRAPVPAALPALVTCPGAQSGHEAQHECVQRVDVRTERAGEPDAIDRLDPEGIHQQAASRVERPLGELDLAHIVLGDDEARRARGVVHHVGEGAVVGLDALAACGQRPVDHPVGGDRPRRGTAPRSPR